MSKAFDAYKNRNENITFTIGANEYSVRPPSFIKRLEINSQLNAFSKLKKDDEVDPQELRKIFLDGFGADVLARLGEEDLDITGLLEILKYVLNPQAEETTKTEDETPSPNVGKGRPRKLSK